MRNREGRDAPTEDVEYRRGPVLNYLLIAFGAVGLLALIGKLVGWLD